MNNLGKSVLFSVTGNCWVKKMNFPKIAIGAIISRMLRRILLKKKAINIWHSTRKRQSAILLQLPGDLILKEIKNGFAGFRRYL